MELHELVYSSLATGNMSHADLIALLEEARDENARRDITGLLLYRNQEFMQLLEGDRDQIFAMYKAICADPRNRNNYLMWDGSIEQRSFPGWSMAFFAPTELDLQSMPGYVEFFSSGFDRIARTSNMSTGRRFLHWHREAFLRQQRKQAQK